MKSFVSQVASLLIAINLMLVLVDISTYFVTRKQEDRKGKELPVDLLSQPGPNPAPSRTMDTSISPELKKEIQKGGTSVVLVHSLGNSMFNTWGFNSKYRDSNGNGVMDEEDLGYVTPGSTIKVLVAYCVYKKVQVTPSKTSIIRRALVVSDNTAANKMVDWLGGTKGVQECFKEEGFKDTFINRRFGSRTPEGRQPCLEGGVYSNCTTGETLVRVMEYLVSGNNTLGLSLGKDKRQKVLSILSLRPKAIGVNEPDDYCAFFREPGPQKCGVALLDNSLANIAYIPNKQLVVFVGYRGYRRVEDAGMAPIVDAIYRVGLRGARNE